MAHQLLLKMSHLVILLALSIYRIAATGFTEHPIDVSVTEGGDATFRCGTDLPCSFFYWGRYHASTGSFSYISKCLSSYEIQYSIEIEGNVYSLHVQDVNLEDTGTVFECWQYDQRKWLKSANATLTVVPASRVPEPPVCQTEPPGPRVVGETVSFQCSAPTEQKSVILSWQTSRKGSNFGNRMETVPGLTNIVEWTLTEKDNFEKFICTAGDDSSRANCTVIPLSIPTNVTITPRSLTVTEGEDAVFLCHAQAVPDATSYTWLITKDGVTYTVGKLHDTAPYQTHDFIVDDSGRTLHILNASSTGEDGMEVSCTASNELNMTGRSLLSVLSVTDLSNSHTGITYTSPTSMKTRSSPSINTKRGENAINEKDDLSEWSHMTLVIGIMLCVIVLFVAAGMGMLYARWRRNMNNATQEQTSPSPTQDVTFSLHDTEADFRRGSLGCVRASAIVDGSPLQQFGDINENEYTEIFGNQAHTPAPAHERAVSSEPIYERRF